MEYKSEIMALDLSLRSTGLVILSREISIIESIVIKPHLKLRFAPRLSYILLQIKFYYEKYIPKLVVIEDYAFSARGMVFSIGELGGVVRLWLYERGIPFLIVGPSQLKKFVSGKGNCPKERILLSAFKKWKIDMQTDMVEAYCLARVGLAILNISNSAQYLSYEEDVLRKMYDENNPDGTYDIQKGGLRNIN